MREETHFLQQSSMLALFSPLRHPKSEFSLQEMNALLQQCELPQQPFIHTSNGLAYHVSLERRNYVLVVRTCAVEEEERLIQREVCIKLDMGYESYELWDLSVSPFIAHLLDDLLFFEMFVWLLFCFALVVLFFVFLLSLLVAFSLFFHPLLFFKIVEDLSLRSF